MPDFAYLGDCSLFRGLSLEQRARIYALCEYVELEEGEIVFSVGDPSDLLYVVCDGEVRISLPTVGESEEALTICGPGRSFGELDLLDDRPAQRSATAVAHTACGLASLSRAALASLSHGDAELGYRMARNAIVTLGEQIRQTNQKLQLLASANLFGG